MMYPLVVLSLLLQMHDIRNNGVAATEEPPTSEPNTTRYPTTSGSQVTGAEGGVCSSSSCRRGYDGPQGPQGLPGVQGIQGPRGSPGIEGCRGMPGRIGPHGMSGIPGVAGSPGVQGVVGLKGDKGDPGTCICEVEIAPPEPRQAASHVKPAQTYSAPFYTGRASAFSVARVTPIVPDLTNNNTAITFDMVYTNLGNDFDMNTGTYICPLNGTYHFSTHVYKHKIMKKPSVRMYKNDQYIMVIDDFAPPNSHDSTSSTVILSLVKGDRIWLDLNRKVKMHHNLWRRTIFSGFLLFPSVTSADP